MKISKRITTPNIQEIREILAQPRKDLTKEKLLSDFTNSEILENIGINLTSLAKNKNLEEEEFLEREKEIISIMEILIKYYKNNPLIVGNIGIGKTSLIKLLAQKIANNLVPFILENRQIIELNIYKYASLPEFKQTLTTEGEVRTRQKFVYDIVAKASNVIFFIDDMHILSTSSHQFIDDISSIEYTRLIREIINNSSIQCIGTISLIEYEKEFKDSLFLKKFHPLYINELSVVETINILNNIKYKLEFYHNIEILPEAITLAVDLSSRYIVDKFFPTKALDILDQAATAEVIKLTHIKQNSNIIFSIINAILINIGRLRLNAFKRKDIASEFLFQEIENIYKNFFLHWLKSPTNFTITSPSNILTSPLSTILYKKIKIAILKDIDNLLYFSNNITKLTYNYNLNNKLYINKNKKIFNKLYKDFKNNKIKNLNIQKISLVLFILWKNNNKINNILNNKSIYYFFKNYLLNNKVTIRKITNLLYTTNNFNISKNNIKILNNTNNNYLDVFKNSLDLLKPILQDKIISFFNKPQFTKNNLNLSHYNTLSKLLTYDLNKQLTINLISPIKQNKKQITKLEIYNLISKLVKVPLDTGTISATESNKLIRLESILHERIVGQEKAIIAIAKTIRRAKLGVRNPSKPIGSFLFCGSTGVGKTEITKTLAEVLFGSEQELIRYDMSEFAEKHNVSRLIGSPAGYVGYEDGGQLTKNLKDKPHCVVLFDELEKAHPDILTLFLQILDEGHLTDTRKNLIKFNNALIVMTSNIGAKEIQQYVLNNKQYFTKPLINSEELNLDNNSIKITKTIKYTESSAFINFKEELHNEFKKSRLISPLKSDINLSKSKIDTVKSPEDIDKELDKLMNDALIDAKLKPEFINRIDNIIVFLPLQLEDLYKIFDILIKNINKRLVSKNISISIENQVKVKICQDSNDIRFGARPLRRSVTINIEDLLADYFLKHEMSIKKKILTITLNQFGQVIIKS